jgi:acyl carrier protein
VETEAGPHLRADWTWSTSVLEAEQVSRLSELWFEALAGICLLVRRGGGGLTPSDVAPAQLSQQHIDELQQRYEVSDILPLTPLQQGLLFHARTARPSVDDAYAVQMAFTVAGPLDVDGLRAAVSALINRHPHLVARFSEQFEQPVQIISAEPEIAWQETELDTEEQIAQLCAAERAAVCDLDDSPAFRVALIRLAENRHRCVLTFNHIVLDGWSMPLLLQELFAGYYGHRLPPPAPYRKFVSWLADRDLEAARAAWSEVLAGFDTPTLVGSAARSVSGERASASFRLSEETTRALGELARSQHTTVNTVLQGAWALLLSTLTGQRDVAFGAVVSGRPPELAGAESMVGLLINTVPVRAIFTSDTTAADLLEQLQDDRNHTLEHQHLGLPEIHRIAGQRSLFDTVFVYENYPIDTVALSDANGLAITDATTRDYYHYPLAVQALPGAELNLLVQFRTDIFERTGIEALIGGLQQILAAMSADPARPLSSIELANAVEPLQHPANAKHVDNPPPDSSYRAPATLVEQLLAGIYAQALGLDRVGVDDSFFDLGGDSISAMRVIAGVNSALDVHLAVGTLFDTPTVKSLAHHIPGTRR